VKAPPSAFGTSPKYDDSAVGFGGGRDLQAKVNALRELQSTSGEESSALISSVLDKAFKDEL